MIFNDMRFSKRLSVLLLLTVLTVAATAKIVTPAHLYMFGFSASFKDTSVYLTDIQDVQGACIDSKTDFLFNRDGYAQQLRDYLANSQQQPGRVCVVIYATSLKKAEKKFRKFQRIYIEKGSYDVRKLTAADFRFTPEMSDEE